MKIKYSFIGVGNIARAFLGAMNTLEGKLACDPSDIFLFDKNSSQTEEFKKSGYVITNSIFECINASDYVFLCVKPQNYREVLSEIKNSKIHLTGKTFVSVAAGISTKQICECIGTDVAVIRTMPNTPLTIGQGVCAACRNEMVSSKAFERVCRIISSKAELLILDESKMNAIIGITGSSPAYVYRFIDAISDSAIKQGLDDPKILSAICKVFIGSAMMVLESKKDIKDLISAVRSPNGTTEKALEIFDSLDIDSIIDKAIIACNERADTLGEEM